MEPLFLGIDAGTSPVKTVISDESGRALGQASAPLRVSRRRSNWSEQQPDAWGKATNSAVLALDAAQRRAVAAIGLSSQRYGATLLGEDLRPHGTGAEWNSIAVIGGGARSTYWGRIPASTLGRSLVYRSGGEVAPAFGAARLSQLAAGGGSSEQICAAPPVLYTVDPEPAPGDVFAARIVKYRALHELFKETSK